MTTSPVMGITEELLAELELLAIDAFEGQTTRMQQDARKELSEAVPALVARIRELEAREVELPKPPMAQRSDEEATFSAGGCDMLRKCKASIEDAGIRIKP